MPAGHLFKRAVRWLTFRNKRKKSQALGGGMHHGECAIVYYRQKKKSFVGEKGNSGGMGKHWGNTGHSVPYSKSVPFGGKAENLFSTEKKFSK